MQQWVLVGIPPGSTLVLFFVFVSTCRRDGYILNLRHSSSSSALLIQKILGKSHQQRILKLRPKKLTFMQQHERLSTLGEVCDTPCVSLDTSRIKSCTYNPNPSVFPPGNGFPLPVPFFDQKALKLCSTRWGIAKTEPPPRSGRSPPHKYISSSENFPPGLLDYSPSY